MPLSAEVPVPVPVAPFAKLDIGNILRGGGDKDPRQLFLDAKPDSLDITLFGESRATQLDTLIQKTLGNDKATIIIPAGYKDKLHEGSIEVESEYYGHRVVIDIRREDLKPDKLKELWESRRGYRPVRPDFSEPDKTLPAKDYVFQTNAADLLNIPRLSESPHGYGVAVYWNDVADSRKSTQPELRHGPNRVIERVSFNSGGRSTDGSNQPYVWEIFTEQGDDTQLVRLFLPYDTDKSASIPFQIKRSRGKGSNLQSEEMQLFYSNPDEAEIELKIRNGDAEIIANNSIRSPSLYGGNDKHHNKWRLRHGRGTATSAQVRLFKAYGIVGGENNIPHITRIYASLREAFMAMKKGLQIRPSQPTESAGLGRLPGEQNTGGTASREFMLLAALNLKIGVPQLMDVLRVKKSEIGELCGISETDVLGIIERTASLEEIDPDSVVTIIKPRKPDISERQTVSVLFLVTRLKSALKVLRSGSGEDKFGEYVALLRLVRQDKNILPVLAVIDPSRVEELKSVIARGSEKK